MWVENKTCLKSLTLHENSLMTSQWWSVVAQFSSSRAKPLLVSLRSKTKMSMIRCPMFLCYWTISRSRVKSKTLFAMPARTVDHSQLRSRNWEQEERSIRSRSSRRAAWKWTETQHQLPRIWSHLTSQSRCPDEHSSNTERFKAKIQILFLISMKRVPIRKAFNQVQASYLIFLFTFTIHHGVLGF